MFWLGDGWEGFHKPGDRRGVWNMWLQVAILACDHVKKVIVKLRGLSQGVRKPQNKCRDRGVNSTHFISRERWEESSSELRLLQPDMEVKSFTKIVERQVRKALRAEEEQGESWQKTWTYWIKVYLSAPSCILWHQTGFGFVWYDLGMSQGKVLSVQSASKPIKLITALQMIKPEGHSL